LGPWIVQISMSEVDRITVLSNERIEYLFGVVSTTESNLSLRYLEVYDWDNAKHYQEHSIRRRG
jgi:hypothetical protein